MKSIHNNSKLYELLSYDSKLVVNFLILSNVLPGITQEDATEAIVNILPLPQLQLQSVTHPKYRTEINPPCLLYPSTARLLHETHQFSSRGLAIAIMASPNSRRY